MNGLLDLGNSRFKFGCVEGSRTMLREVFPADDVEALCRCLHGQPGGALYMTAVAVDRKDLVQAVKESWEGPVHVIDSARASREFVLHYEHPETFGVDRLLALRAARLRSDGACLVVDAGTAVTIDGLARDAVHAGGWILPGLSLLQAALAPVLEPGGPQATAQPNRMQCTGTREAIDAGTLHLLAGGIDRMCRVLCSGSLEGAPVFGCGGDIRLLEDWCETSFLLAPDLVLEGLASLAREQET